MRLIAHLLTLALMCAVLFAATCPPSAATRGAGGLPRDANGDPAVSVALEDP